MDVQFAPDGLAVGDVVKLHTRKFGKAVVLAIGLAVVIVRDGQGWTRTLLRKRVSYPARIGPGRNLKNRPSNPESPNE